MMLLVSMLYFVFSPPQSAYAEDTNNSAGAIVTVNGLAEVTRGGSRVALKPGDSVFPHDVIDVAKGGSIKLLLNDKSILDIGSGAAFRVDKYIAHKGVDREVELAVAHGTLRSAVTQKVEGNGKFHVKTSSATMGVRGTDFVVQADTKTQVTVIQGQVEVAQNTASSGGGAGKFSQHSGGRTVVLNSGQQVTSTPGAPLPEKVTTLNAVALKQVVGTSKVADNTYSRAITIVTASNSNPAAPQPSSTGGRAPASTSNSSAGDNGGSTNSGGPTTAGNGPGSPQAGSPGNTTGAPVEPTMATAGEGPAGSGNTPANGSANAPTLAAGGPGAPPPMAPPPPLSAAGFGGITLGDIGTVVSTVVSIPPPINTTQIGITGTFNPGTPAGTVNVHANGTSNITIVVNHQ